MDKLKYKKIVSKYKVKENVFRNSVIAFLVGGLMGVLAQGTIDLYSYIFNMSTKEACVYMITTYIFLGCLFTCFGWFDKVVNFARCGLIIPITGFAHATQSAALEYKKEGLVTGIGANMLKLSGTVIIYGVISAYVFGLLRYLVIGG